MGNALLPASDNHKQFTFTATIILDITSMWICTSIIIYLNILDHFLETLSTGG